MNPMFVGSYVPAESPSDHFVSASVLTVEGIMEKHKLSLDEIAEIEQKLKRMTLSDILFHYPDGPRYDIALNLIATLA
jgi:hypothetical protein